jgi:hypothetical protein
MANFAIRKLADRESERVKLFDPLTGEVALYTSKDAETLVPLLQEALTKAGVSPTPRPLRGVQIEDKPPKRAKLPTGFVANGISEGWIEAEGEGELVVRSSGPRENPFGPAPHTFIHYDALIFKTVDGDVRYEVVENPDKWPEEKDGVAGFGGEVRHFYEVKLDG